MGGQSLQDLSGKPRTLGCKPNDSGATPLGETSIFISPRSVKVDVSLELIELK